MLLNLCPGYLCSSDFLFLFCCPAQMNNLPTLSQFFPFHVLVKQTIIIGKNVKAARIDDLHDFVRRMTNTRATVTVVKESDEGLYLMVQNSMEAGQQWECTQQYAAKSIHRWFLQGHRSVDDQHRGRRISRCGSAFRRIQMKGSLALPPGPSGQAVRVVLQLCGLTADYCVEAEAGEPVLTVTDPVLRLAGVNTVCRYLASIDRGNETTSLAFLKGSLLGETPILAAEVCFHEYVEAKTRTAGRCFRC